jgi:hypothetical protein
MILSGIVYAQLLSSDDPIVIGLLVAGFSTLIVFSLGRHLRRSNNR